MGNFISSIFGLKTSQDSGITGRDLQPETKAATPESPVFGGSDTNSLVRGKDALKIGLDKAAGTSKMSSKTINN